METEIFAEAASLCINADAPLATVDVRLGKLLLRGVEVYLDRGPSFGVHMPAGIAFKSGSADNGVVLPDNFKVSIEETAISAIRQLMKGFKYKEQCYENDSKKHNAPDESVELFGAS